MADPLQIDLDEKVRQFVALASGLDFDTAVIPGNDSAPSPNIPYASVLEIIEKGNGIDSEVAIEGPDPQIQKTLKQSGSRSITYSVQFYKAGAADNAKSLLSFPSTTPGQIWLAENDLTWMIAGDIVNLDSVMGSKNEIRRAVDITFRYQSKRQVDIHAIGSVNIDVNLSAEDDYNENVEVTDA